jgi:hypothetical protein
MARELAEKDGVGVSADAVWEELRKERTDHLPPTPAAEAASAIEMRSKVLTCSTEAEPTLAAGSVMVHSQPKTKEALRRTGYRWRSVTTLKITPSGQQPRPYEVKFVGTRV